MTTKKVDMRVMQHRPNELPFEKWNANTFYAYLCQAHREVRGVDYFAAKGKMADVKMIKDFLNEYGRDLTKAFIDECLKTYKANGKYLVCTFMFMSTYMKAQVLPKLQLDAQRAQQEKKEEEQGYEGVQW